VRQGAATQNVLTTLEVAGSLHRAHRVGRSAGRVAAGRRAPSLAGRVRPRDGIRAAHLAAGTGSLSVRRVRDPGRTMARARVGGARHRAACS
jgi:hypothetical protein